MNVIDFLKNLFGGKTSDSVSSNNDSVNQNVTSNYQANTKVVTIGDNLYRLKGNSSIEISKNNGKKWNHYTDVPVDCSEIKVSEDNCLMFLGSRDYKGVKEVLKDAYGTQKQELGELGGTVVKEMTDQKVETELWQIRDRWYKMDLKGRISVAKDPQHPETFSLLESTTDTMIIKKKECKIRVYNMTPRDSYYSEDGISWKYLESFDKEFKSFAHKYGTTIAIDVKGKEYVFDNEWIPIEYTAELEVFENDGCYKDIDEIYYEYKTDDEKIVSKKVQLLFIKGEMGIESSVAYVTKKGIVEHYSSLPGFWGKLPDKIECHYGDVIITRNDKSYISFEGDWELTNDWEKGVGPFCFKGRIDENDPFWDKVDTPIDEKDNWRTILYKVLKSDSQLVFYSSDGVDWSFHSELPEEFKALTSTLGYSHAMSFNTIVYCDNKKHYEWKLKKSGLIKKTYSAGWEKCDEGNLLVKISR